MKTSVKYYLLFALTLISPDSFGQADTLLKLSLTNFLQLVKQNHPLAKQADLIIESADANTLAAKGNFDPKLFYTFRDKFYDSKNYYELGDGGIKIPTWAGIEIKAGYENNSGTYLNPESTVPEQGLIYTQVSMSLLQGLLIDDRRATIKQAKLFQDLSEFEKINLINELLYKAGKVYWDWQLSYTNLQVYKNAIDISRARFEAVIKTSVLGDRPAIDTVEASIQLQERIINYQQALLDYQTKSLLLSNFLWLENDVPIVLTDNTIPETYSEKYDLENSIFLNVDAIDSLINIHPGLRIYDFKLKQLAIEKQFKQDKLKPNLNVEYSLLFNGDNPGEGYQNNYKWGVTVGFPIFLRKERGELKLTKFKIENTTYENINKRNELLNKTKASINEFNNYSSQIKIFSSNVLNYERLWLSEKRLFDYGESSLFMINSREQSYINAQIKLNEIVNKNKKSALEVKYAFGVLNTYY